MHPTAGGPGALRPFLLRSGCPVRRRSCLVTNPDWLCLWKASVQTAAGARLASPGSVASPVPAYSAPAVERACRPAAAAPSA